MPRHLRTWSVYIISVYNILYGRCATGKLGILCMHMFCKHSMRGKSLCVCACMCALWLNHKLNMGSPGSFWSFWPFSTSARKGERKDKEEMFRISTFLGLLSRYRGKAQSCYSSPCDPFQRICWDGFSSREWGF